MQAIKTCDIVLTAWKSIESCLSRIDMRWGAFVDDVGVCCSPSDLCGWHKALVDLCASASSLRPVDTHTHVHAVLHMCQVYQKLKTSVLHPARGKQSHLKHMNAALATYESKVHLLKFCTTTLKYYFLLLLLPLLSSKIFLTL